MAQQAPEMRRADRLVWLAVLLIVAAVAVANTSELAADILGVGAGFAWIGSGVLRWRLASAPEIEPVQARLRTWLGPLFILIGLSSVILNIVRIVQMA